jgi:hypothetical protein
MDKMLIKKGKFKASIKYNEDICNISLKIPREEKDFDPSQFNDLIGLLMKMCMKKDEYEVYINNVLQKQTSGEQIESTSTN